MTEPAPITELRWCQFSREVGQQCKARANHQWGPIALCCDHFDQLVTAMFEIQGLVADRRHSDFVKLYEERTSKSSLAEGSHCAGQDATKGESE